jgi:hypothetical protein
MLPKSQIRVLKTPGCDMMSGFKISKSGGSSMLEASHG